jgi:hypothetical protein
MRQLLSADFVFAATYCENSLSLIGIDRLRPFSTIATYPLEASTIKPSATFLPDSVISVQ